MEMGHKKGETCTKKKENGNDRRGQMQMKLGRTKTEKNDVKYEKR